MYKIFATDFFERKLKRLARKYRRIDKDYKNLVESLEKDPFAGDRLKGCPGPVFKIRMSSMDMQRGKSGGFRVIYLIEGKGSKGNVFLLTLYAKGEKENINAREISKILRQTGLDD